MVGVVYLALFELSGLLLVFALERRRILSVKIWLGLVVGLMEMMWLPSLYAFIFDFGTTAHIFALATAIAAGATCLIICKIRSRRNESELQQGSKPPLWLMLVLLVPSVLLAARLHYTHTFREIDGALYVGQSTYGDLCMHASFITGLVNQSYPPEYTLLPGTRLGYPFLADAMSSSMYLMGTPLNLSIVIPGVIMTALVFWGFVMFSWELTRSKAATALAFALLIFSGGLGFLYYFDLNGTFNLSSLSYGGSEAFKTVSDALNEYYYTPANFTSLNLRWVNALSDLLIPQRTLLAGWMCLIPALYLLYTAMKRSALRDFILLGCFAGPMVMIHTHSFLGLGLISLGAFIDRLIRGKGRRLNVLIGFCVYGGIACALALPQLLIWTFPQSIGGGSIKFLFNWVNNSNGTLKDNYLWFWIKNVGPMFLIIPFAAICNKTKLTKALSLGSLIVFIVAELFVFQPNVYDNNKLFWVAYLCMLPIGCMGLVRFIGEHKHMLVRAGLSVIMVIVMTLSGALSVLRELNSGETSDSLLSLTPVIKKINQSNGTYYGDYTAYPYQIFSVPQVEAAEYIKQNTFEDALFLTANNHNNSVATLTGRKIVCGAGTFLYFHGLDYYQQESDAKRMLSDPKAYSYLFREYGVDYVFLSSYEISQAGVGYSAFDELFPCVFTSNETYFYDIVRIYAVSERACVKFQQDAANLLQ